MNGILRTIGIGCIATLVLATAPTTTEARPPHYAPPQHHKHHHHSDTAAAIIGGIAVIGTIAAIASAHESDAAVDVGVSYGHGHSYSSVHYSRPVPPPRRYWVSGYYEVERQRVCIPGYWDEVIEPAEYKKVRRGCEWRYIQVKPECVRKVWVPERYEWQETKVWVPGHWESDGPPRHARVY